MGARFHRRVVAHPWWTIAAVLVPTLLLAWRAVHVRFDNSIEALLPAGHPAVLQDREVKALFDSREMLLIGVVARPTVFHPRALTKVAELSDAIWQVELADDQDARRLAAWEDRVDPARRRAIAGILEGGLDATDRGGVVNLWLDVREHGSDDGLARFLDELRLKFAPVSDVLSLSEVEDVRASPEGLDIDPPMDEIPVSTEDLQALARRVFDNEMFVGGLVSADSGADGPAAVLSTMEELTGPIVVTSVTDMAGFGSLAFTGLASIRDFGVFTSFGALVALGVSLTLVPAALVLLPRPGVRPERSRGARLRRVLGRVADAAARRRRAVVLGAIAFTAAALLTFPRIQVGSTMLGYFHEDSEIYRSSEMINRRFGGTEVLNIVVDTRTPGGLI